MGHAKVDTTMNVYTQALDVVSTGSWELHTATGGGPGTLL